MAQNSVLQSDRPVYSVGDHVLIFGAIARVTGLSKQKVDIVHLDRNYRETFGCVWLRNHNRGHWEGTPAKPVRDRAPSAVDGRVWSHIYDEDAA